MQYSPIIPSSWLQETARAWQPGAALLYYRHPRPLSRSMRTSVRSAHASPTRYDVGASGWGGWEASTSRAGVPGWSSCTIVSRSESFSAAGWRCTTRGTSRRHHSSSEVTRSGGRMVRTGERSALFLSLPLAVCCGRNFCSSCRPDSSWCPSNPLAQSQMYAWPFLWTIRQPNVWSMCSNIQASIWGLLLLTFFALLASRMGLRQVGVGGRLDAETSIISKNSIFF